jgi:ABC-type transporter Mla subunit MlaD
MSTKTHNELTAGLFVLLCVAAMMGVVLWLGASDLFKKTHQRAAFYVNESSGSLGLKKGNSVQVGDRPIGRIVEILSDGGKSLYMTEIEVPDVKVYSDGKARVSVPLVGESKLVITARGSVAAGLADEQHPVIVAGGLDQAMADLAEMAETLKPIAQIAMKEFDTTKDASILARVHRVMEDLKSAASNIAGQTDVRQKDSLVAKVNASADDVNRITSSVAFQTDAAKPASLLAKFHRSTDDVNTITADAKPKIEQTLTAARNTAQQVESISKKDVMEILAGLRKANSDVLKISGNFVEVSEQAKSILVMNRDRIDEMIDDMGQVAENLKSTSKDVHRNPWRLLYKPDKEELHSQNIYDAARAFAGGAEQLDSAINKLRALSRSNPGAIPANDPELLKVRKQIEETFGNFTKAEQALWKEVAK